MLYNNETKTMLNNRNTNIKNKVKVNMLDMFTMSYKLFFQCKACREFVLDNL